MNNLSRYHRTVPLFGLALLLVLGWSSRTYLAAQEADEKELARPGVSQATLDAWARLDDRPGPQDLEAMTFTPCEDGFAGPYPCNNVDLMAFIPVGAINAGSTNDIWGWTDPQTGTEYGLLGLDNGTAFFDLTDPANPLYLGKLPTHSSNSTWRGIKVYADHAFVVSEAFNHGLQVFDLTELRDVTNPPVIFSETAHYDGFSNSHTVAVNEETGYAYAAGTNTCSGGLHMVNIQNPTSPTFAGCFSSDGYTHENQCVIYNGPDTQHQGKEICFNYNEDTLTIVDVTNKATPIQLARKGYSGSAYTHQGWLTADHQYALHDDELDETSFGHNTRTHIWDLTDLDNPVRFAFYDGPTPAIDHNLYIHEGNAFESNYTSGVRILDLEDIANGNLSEVAFFDLYPSSNSPGFSGTWSNYPYFDSGIVIATSIDEGMFVLDPILPPDFRMDLGATDLKVCDMGSDSLTIDITDRFGYVGAVTLSAVGLPAGSNATFSVNPVSVPGSSDLTVSVTTAAAGTYPFTVHGTDGVITHDEDATLSVYDALPGMATLTAPANGVTDVLLSPTFEWTAASQGDLYQLQVATDPQFNNVVYSASVDGTSHTAATSLEPETLYYWRVRALNLCGTGQFSAAFSFTTRAVPPILLVDDDDNAPDVQVAYTTALNSMLLSYDIWDTQNSDDEPTAVELDPYSLVIWFTGVEFDGAAGPGAAGETALGSWLDSGSRCLFLSSQDYYYDRGLTAFMQTYLGLASAQSDVSQTQVVGRTLFNGLGPYTLSYPFMNYSDIVNPDATARVAFSGDQGRAAIVKRTPAYATTFLGFPWEAIPTAADRAQVLNRIIGPCQ